jgi:hypothetical protein
MVRESPESVDYLSLSRDALTHYKMGRTPPNQAPDCVKTLYAISLYSIIFLQ